MIMGARVEGSSDSLVPSDRREVREKFAAGMKKLGIANEKEVQIETLAQRLRDEVISRGAVIVLPPLVGAWTRTLLAKAN